MSGSDETYRQKKDIVFHCGDCRTAIIRNSREHDECITKDDKTWYCGDCAFNHLDDDEEDECGATEGAFCEGCGVHECFECKEDCSYQFWRRWEETRLEALLLRQPHLRNQTCPLCQGIFSGRGNPIYGIHSDLNLQEDDKVCDACYDRVLPLIWKYRGIQ